MPSWSFDPDALIPSTPDPDTVEVPEPYTEAEWAETEGSLENRVSTAASPRGFESVDPAPFIDGWHNRDPE
jgi:hypothetical protein